MRALSFFLIAFLLVAAPARAEQLAPTGSAAAALAGGGSGFLAVWIQRGPNGVAIVARRVTDTGRPVGPARVVGTTRSGFAMTAPPSAVWNPRRREYLVAFQATSPAEASGDVEMFVRRIGRDGRPRGAVRRATRTGDPASGLQRSMKPSLVLDPRTGESLLAFTATVSDDGKRELRVQRLSPKGARLGRARRVGPAPAESGGGTSGVAGVLPGRGWLAMLDAFGFANGKPTPGAISLQRLTRRATPDGRPRAIGPELAEQTALTLSRHPRSGRTLAVWQRTGFSNRTLYTRLLGRDGRPTGGYREMPYTRTWDSISFAPYRDGWAILLARYLPGGDRDIFLGRLSANGGRKGDLVRITTFARQPNTTSGPNDDRFVYAPVIASNARGRLVGLWTEEPEGGPGSELHVRRLN